jgi:hypothetical protein
MGSLKNAIMWLEENGYEASNENLHLASKAASSIKFKLETSQHPDTHVWSIAVISKELDLTAVFVSLDRQLAIQDAADYIEYKSR